MYEFIPYSYLCELLILFIWHKYWPPVLVQVLRMTRVRTFLQVNILISLPMLNHFRHFWNNLLSIDFNLLPQPPGLPRLSQGCGFHWAAGPRLGELYIMTSCEMFLFWLWRNSHGGGFSDNDIVTTRLPTSSCWCPSWTRASTTSSSSPSRCTTSPAALLGLGEQADKPTLKARSGPNFVG